MRDQLPPAGSDPFRCPEKPERVDLRLSWRTDPRARARLEARLFGNRILFSNRDWAVPDIVAAYRSQSDAEFGFRQLTDPHVVSFSPMHHWTDSKIRVHVFYCVLALATVHLMRRHADQAGLHLSVRELLDQLAGIEETVLLYHDGGKGRPRAQRILTDMTPPSENSPSYSTFTDTPPPADHHHPQHNKLGNTPGPPENPPPPAQTKPAINKGRKLPLGPQRSASRKVLRR